MFLMVLVLHHIPKTVAVEHFTFLRTCLMRKFRLLVYVNCLKSQHWQFVILQSQILFERDPSNSAFFCLRGLKPKGYSILTFLFKLYTIYAFSPYVSTLTDNQFFVILGIGYNVALCSVAELCDLDKLSLLFQFTKVLHYLKKNPKKQNKTKLWDHLQGLLPTFFNNFFALS